MTDKLTKPKDDRVEVTLAVSTHTHNGKPVDIGGKITVRRAQAKWMSDNKLIKEEIN